MVLDTMLLEQIVQVQLIFENICSLLPQALNANRFLIFLNYAYGLLKILDSSMFMLGVDPSSPYQLHLYKHTFGSISPNWCLKLLWPSGTWTIYYSESLLISSTIYTFFPYGSSIHYLYMAAISLSDGTVSNRYKSSTSWTNVWGSGVNGDYIAASVVCSSDHLLIFNRATNLFDIKSFSGTYLYGIGLDITGR